MVTGGELTSRQLLTVELTVRDMSLTFTGFCSRLKTELKHMMDIQHPRDRSL